MRPHDPLVRTFKEGDSPLARYVAQPVLAFAKWESSSGVAMVLATATALVWANVSWHTYDEFWHHPIALSIGSWQMYPLDLTHFVNDGLMAVFFFVVGIEIKRAVSAGGELNSVRRAALPAIAALGGMVVPALLYFVLNTGGEAARGWGIPMATDIAFAAGIVALLGTKVHPSLKLFLLTLAIVDDIGAITVIAIFYSDNIKLNWLLAAVGGLVLIRVAQLLRIWWYPVYFAIGFLTWYCTLESGVHATIAGVAIGFMTPARALVSRRAAVESAVAMEVSPTEEQLRKTAFVFRESMPLTEHLEYALHPFTALVFVPTFALANAGLQLSGSAMSDALTSTAAWGIVIGLVVGKPLGIAGFTYVATRFGFVLPGDARWPQFMGIAFAAGIGFTVSFFVATLAFTEEAITQSAKVGILFASAVAAFVALAMLNRVSETHPHATGRGWLNVDRERDASEGEEFAFIPPGTTPAELGGEAVEVSTTASAGVDDDSNWAVRATDASAGDDAGDASAGDASLADDSAGDASLRATRHPLIDSPPSPWRVLIIPGDDAAPEAMAATMSVLEALEVPIVYHQVPTGRDLERLAPDERDQLVASQIDTCDTVLFGASNGITPGAALMRWGKQTYANVRPVRWRPGYRSPLADPSSVDYVIVRENLEDMYVGIMGDAADLLAGVTADARSRVPAGAQQGRFAAKIITRPGTEQVTRFACELALSRRGHLTVSAKTNMLPATDRYFCDIAREVAQEYAGLTFSEYIVDDMAHRLVASPAEIDVLLLPNLYGDVLSDAAAGTIGGMGLAPSGCFGDHFAYFEPAHGTAPDIAGQERVNPTATLLSAVMMLRYLGYDEVATRLDKAITSVYARGAHLTPDQGGTASTSEFANAVLSDLA